MLALKEFANFINLSLANLAATYAQLLLETDQDYAKFSKNSRIASGRKLLKAVSQACEAQTSDPLIALFDDNSDKTVQRWAADIIPPDPSIEVECLGQTLLDVVPNLEAGKFLWQMLANVRTLLSSSSQIVPSSLPSSDKQASEKHKQLEDRVVTDRGEVGKALQESQERFWRLSEATFEALIMTAEGEILDVNERFSDIFGYEQAEVMGMDVWKLVASESRELVKQNNLSAYEQPYEAKYCRKDGSIFWAEISSRIISHQGSKVRVTAIRDISERKLAVSTLQQQNLYLVVLHEITLSLVNRLEVKDLLESVIARVATLMRTDHAHITLVAPDGSVLITQVGVGLFKKRIGNRLKPGDGVAGKVWQSGQPLALDNYITVPHRVPGADLEQIQSMVAVPLKSESEFLGVLGLARLEKDQPFTETEIMRLSQFAELASVALDNAQLYSAAQQELAERKQLEQQLQNSLERQTQQIQTSTDVAQEIASALAPDDLFERVVNLIWERFGYYHVQLYTLEDDYLIVQAGTGEAGRQLKAAGYKIALKAEQSLMARSARSGRSLLISDVSQEATWLPDPRLPETKSEIVAPIKLQDEVLGVLDGQSDRVGGITQEDEISLLGLCGQIAVAINTRQAESQRAQTEATLIESEQKYKDLVDSLPVGIYRNTPGAEGHFLEVNPAIATMFEGNSVAEFLDHNVSDFYSNPDDRAKFSQKIQEQGFVKNEELALRTLKGKELWAAVTAVMKEDKEGQVYFDGMIADITERKQFEEALRKSEEKYRATLENIEDGIYEVDLMGNITFFNNALCSIIGYPAAELRGMNNREYTDEANSKLLYAAFRQTYETDEPVHRIEWEVIRKDGSKGIVENSITLMRDENGEPVGFRGVARDITERKQADEVLRASEERYRLLLEASPDPIVLYDDKGRVTYLNPAFTQVFGWAADELLGQRIDFVAKESMQQTQEAVGRVLKGEDVFFETKRLTKNGNKIDVLVSASVQRDQAGNRAGMVVILRDISERKQTERVLKASEKRLRTLLEASPDPIVNYDIEGQVLYLNPAFTQTFGWTEAELLGKHIDFVPADEEIQAATQAAIKNLLKNEYAYGFETKRLTKEGEVIDVEISGALLFDEQRNPLGSILFFRNITERKQTEENLAQTLSETQTLYETSQALTGASRIETMLEALLVTLNKYDVALGANSIVFSQLELDENGQPEWGEVVAWWLRTEQEPPYPVGSRFYLKEMRTAQTWIHNPLDPVFISDGQQDEREQEGIVEEGNIYARAILPLSVAGRWIGVLSINWAETHQFSAHDKRIYRVVMGQLAGVIENQRLFAESQQRVVETETLYDVSAQLNAVQSYDEIISILRKFTPQSQNTQAITLGYFDHAWTKDDVPEGVRILARWIKVKDTFFSSRYLLADFPTADKFLRPDEMIIIEDIAHDPRMDEQTRSTYLDRFKTKSTIFAPLVVAGQWVGYINVSYGQLTTFLASEVRRLTALISQASVAVQNLKNIAAVQERAAQLEKLTRIEIGLSQAATEEEILSALAQNLKPGQPDRIILQYLETDANDNPLIAENVAVWDSGAIRPDDPSNRRRYPVDKYSLSNLWLTSPNEALFIADVMTDPRVDEGLRQVLTELGIGAFVNMPLRSSNRWQGLIALDWSTRHVYTEGELLIFQQLLEPIAAVIATRRASLAQQEALAETEILYQAGTELSAAQSYDDILSVLRRYTIFGQGAQNVSLNCFDRPWIGDQMPDWLNVLSRWSELPADAVSPRYALEIFSGLRQILSPNKPTIFEDVTTDPRFDEPLRALYVDNFGTKSTIFVPLVVGGQWIGQTNAIYQQATTFPEVAVRRLVALSSQAAVAVQSIQRLGETEQQAHELAILNELGRSLTAYLNVEQVLEETYQGGALLMDTSNFFIGLYDSQSHQITFSHAEDSDEKGFTISADQGISGYVVRNRVPVLVEENVEDWMAEKGIETVGDMALSWLGVPLLVGNQTLGLLFVQDFTTTHRYDEHARDLLIAIANQTAIAIQNARQFEQTQAHARREQTIREITEKMRAATSLEELTKTTAQELGQRFSAEYAWVELGFDRPATDSAEPTNDH